MTTETTTDQTTLTTPVWASKTIQPDDGSHSGQVTVGPVTLTITQTIPFVGDPEPLYVWLPEVEGLSGAQACRDLAAALMEAAQVIDNA